MESYKYINGSSRVNKYRTTQLKKLQTKFVSKCIVKYYTDVINS